MYLFIFYCLSLFFLLYLLYKKYYPSIIPIVSIDGNIGVGKSTFTEMLKDYFNSKVIHEPIDEWCDIKDSYGRNILQMYYTDKHRWAYAFQNMAYITRMEKLVEAQKNSRCDIIFTDRSLETDKNVFAKMCFDNKYMNELEWNIYNHWSNFYNKIFSHKQKKNIIYLRASPKVCYERIQKRGRDEEKDISFEYIQTLHTYHEDWLVGNTTDNVLILDCNADFENSIDNMDYLVDDVKDFLNKNKLHFNKIEEK